MVPPVHTLAPMRLLCRSVLRSFVTGKEPKSLFPLKKASPVEVEVEDRNDSGEDTKNESDAESEETSKRRVLKQLKGKTKSKSKKQNLKSVFNEDYQWTSVLTD